MPRKPIKVTWNRGGQEAAAKVAPDELIAVLNACAP
jgi:hypothetical protein